MAQPRTWNIAKLNARIEAADAALDPLLASAKITTIKVDGKDVPASEAPLADKITAYAAITNPQANTQDMSELVVTNDQLAKQIETAHAENVRLQAGNAALTQENVQTKADLGTAQASVASLTAANAELNVRHEAALRQVADSTAKFNALNHEISTACLAAGCLEVKGDTESARLTAADALAPSDKLKAYSGAVAATLAKFGANLAQLPNGGPSPLNVVQTGVLAQLDGIKNPTERAKFFKANYAAICAARKALMDAPKS